MSELLRAYLSLTLLRLGPQDLPASRFLLQLSAITMVLSGCLMLSLKGGLSVGVMMAVVLDMGLTAILVTLGLKVTAKSSRLTQTLSALFGSSALIQILTIPLLLLMGNDPSASAVSQLAALVFMLMIVWSLTVVGHILRHAMDLPVWAGLMLAIGYWILINDLLTLLGVE